MTGEPEQTGLNFQKYVMKQGYVLQHTETNILQSKLLQVTCHSHKYLQKLIAN